ncbi:MAG: hypothetical protein JWN70_5035 [Planctomycetaceae bacterium]|nr:hypothetical protein [Planctomycetaceae bacterium]
MLDFEAGDGPEAILAVKKDLIKTGPEVISNILALRPGAVLFILCVTLTLLTLTTS